MPRSPSPSKKGKADTSANGSKQKSTQEEPKLASETKRNTNTMSEQSSIIEFSEDIANAEAPVPLPKGDYPAEIRAAVRKTSAAGNDYGSVTFFIAPEAYPADYSEGDPDGLTLIYNRVSLADTPAGRHRARKFIEAIGAPGGKSIDMNDWVGRTATVTVDHDTYEGETRAVVAKVVAA
jgi:hypothetical protein